MGDPPPRGRVRVLCRGGVASANSACARVRSFGLSSRRVCLRLSSLHATLYTLGDGVAGATLVPAPIVCRGVYGWGRWARAWPLRRGRVGGRLLAADQPDPERTGCQRRLALRARRRWRLAWARCAPGCLRQPGHCLALRARRRRRGRYAPERPHVLPRLRTLSSGGGGDVDDVVRCALLERLGARRASSSCRGRGWGGTPRGSEIGNRPRTRRRNSETPSERGRP